MIRFLSQSWRTLSEAIADMWNDHHRHPEDASDDEEEEEDDDDDSGDDPNRIAIQSAIGAYTTGTATYGHYETMRRQDETHRMLPHHQHHGYVDHNAHGRGGWSGDDRHHPRVQPSPGSEEHADSWDHHPRVATATAYHLREEEDEEDDDDDEEEEDDDDNNNNNDDKNNNDDDDDDDDDGSSDEEDRPTRTASALPPQPRGKPEAMAAKLASASRIQKKLDELESERDDGDDAVARPIDNSEEPVDVNADGAAPVTVVSEMPPPSAPPKKKKRKSVTPKKTISSSNSGVATPSMDDPAPPITTAEYENLEALMVQFCRVPLLAEFSRPVALLHPEVGDKS